MIPELLVFLNLAAPDNGVTGTLVLGGNCRDGVVICADLRQTAETGGFRDDDVKFTRLDDGSVLFSAGTTKLVTSSKELVFDADRVAAEVMTGGATTAQAVADRLSTRLDQAFRQYLASRPRAAWPRPDRDPYFQVGVFWRVQTLRRALVMVPVSYNPLVLDPVQVGRRVETLPVAVTWLRGFGEPGVLDRVRDTARSDMRLAAVVAPYFTAGVNPDTITFDDAEAALRAIIATAARFDASVSPEARCVRIPAAER